MDADWSVELGHDDPALEFPWSSPDGSQRFVDLSKDAEELAKILEATQYSELREFLDILNGRFSPWITAKCDVWLDHELGEAERIYNANLKMCSYIDLIRRDESERFSFERHEEWVKFAASMLRNIGEHPMACELVVRRCWYHSNSQANDALQPGFYVTLYVFGYGNSEVEAIRMWGGGLTRTSFVLSGLRA